MVFRSCRKPSPDTMLSRQRSLATSSVISLVIAVARSAEHLETIVGSVVCFYKEDGPPNECMYSSVCFADKCEAKLVVPPPWTSCIPHNLHRTFTTSFSFSLIATGALKYSQTGLVRFLVNIWLVQGPTPAFKLLKPKYVSGYSRGRNNDIWILDYKWISE